MRLLLALLVGAATLLVGCAAPTAGIASPVSVPEQRAEPTPTPAPGPTPTHLSVPAIEAESTLVSVPLVDGAIEVPPATKPMQAAWWNGSPRPGDLGPAVILGHVDGEIDGVAGRPGIFHRLDELEPGDEIVIDREGGSTAKFAVYLVERVPKADHAQAAGRIYGNTEGPELRLITCGGTFDHGAGSYRDNVIAFARIV